MAPATMPPGSVLGQVRGALKSGLASALRGARPAGPLRRRLGGRGVILLLHEVHEDPASELMTGSSPPFLTETVGRLRHDGWDLVSLHEALRRIGDGTAARPFAVLTFDDGYRDTLTRALPVLERLGAPLTVYVPTGALTRELYAWWLALRALFRTHEEVTIECMGRRFACRDLASKRAALSEASRWVHHDYRRACELAPTFARYGVTLGALADAYFLNPDELRVLARHPLVTIGAHTTSHAALSLLGPDDARREMADNRRYLQHLLDREVVHFAYPYGDPRAGGEREAAIARDVGFISAVTTQPSPVFPGRRHHPHRMPRIGVRPDDTPASLYWRASGLAWALNTHRRIQLAGA